ncbi:DUF3084 domain-containing protein [Oscillatoriales cyanobacterium LEGE 11467]|uniref:DUF3084 domain-containing protein n=1 Tax=Zarconia navalis LEGE 11467 TaxID=1828826 RepID=A0A928VZA4_9CYAN|nr:DUF3084 domain-containing protein [Zarconia navalis]MBE9040933.1 DUF3084 domain-containing protein [Zarconia navalis LEGE 11467]
MTTGYILIVAVLVLGGALATAGDRIGTKVGKARLSLFKLRPRKTATLVTVLTGSVVAASTLGILLAADKQLRTGIFELEELQGDLEKARTDLERTQTQKTQVQQELASAQTEARQRLNAINESLETVSSQQEQTQEQLDLTQEELQGVETQLSQKDEQLAQTETQLSQKDEQLAQTETQLSQKDDRLSQIIAQEERLRSAIDNLQRERQSEQERLRLAIENLQSDRQQLVRRNEEQVETQKQQLTALAEQDKQLREQDRALAERESLLEDLENKQVLLQEQVGVLEENFRLLRERRVAIGRGQVLASGVVRIVRSQATPTNIERAIGRILGEANHVATQLTRPGTTQEDPILKAAPSELEALMEEIQSGEEYVVRVHSAGNYILGENEVDVTISVARNQLVFDEGEPVAEVSLDTSTMSDDEVLERIEILLEASKLRAVQQGILAERIQVADGRPESAIDFIKALQEQQTPLEVRAIATELTYTAGPLNLKLVALQNGEVILESS